MMRFFPFFHDGLQKYNHVEDLEHLNNSLIHQFLSLLIKKRRRKLNYRINLENPLKANIKIGIESRYKYRKQRDM